MGSFFKKKLGSGGGAAEGDYENPDKGDEGPGIMD